MGDHPDVGISQQESTGQMLPTLDTVDVMPTKEFFIETLVKDIDLGATIADLVDNSVDGATRLRGDKDFKDLTIRIDVSSDRFRITDDCGGIPLDLARHYAFRLGRPPERGPTPGSIGQFGVGMKRALFKMGRHFRVESKTTTNSFTLDVDIDAWKKDRDWTFPLQDIEEYDPPLPVEQTGTTIEVTNLFGYVAAEFGLAIFRSRLANDLRYKTQQPIERGLAITLNTLPLDVDPPAILESRDIQPAYREARYEKDEAAPVFAKIYAGLGSSLREEAGWNVYCNGRLVLRADKSSLTGWGEGGGRTIPLYHGEYVRFRGYAFCESDDASRLPWNTTKTGISVDSDVYRALLLDMTVVMRPVIDFLNKLNNEKAEEEKLYAAAVEAARVVPLSQVGSIQRPFTTTISRPPGPRTASIQYRKRVDDIEAVKSSLDVTTNREVGELTFDYYLGNGVSGDGGSD